MTPRKPIDSHERRSRGKDRRMNRQTITIKGTANASRKKISQNGVNSRSAILRNMNELPQIIDNIIIHSQSVAFIIPG